MLKLELVQRGRGRRERKGDERRSSTGSQDNTRWRKGNELYLADDVQIVTERGRSERGESEKKERERSFASSRISVRNARTHPILPIVAQSCSILSNKDREPKLSQSYNPQHPKKRR